MKLSNLFNKKSKYFKQRLLLWHTNQNKREMPWKGVKDIYKIWLSEIILQQTRVEQGRAYYEKFIYTFPTIQDLAAASEKSVMKLWEGLGYYSRCRNLHYTAKFITKEHEGIFPNTYEGLLALKGVGPYTAAAIASFGFNIPKAVVDGNVIRVLSRYFGIHEPVNTTATKKLLENLAELCMDSKQPGTYNQAIMDFGATVCKPVSPHCLACPLRSQCEAYRLHKVEQLPHRTNKIIKTTRWFIVKIIQCNQYYAIHLRPTGDIWAGLHAFPMTEQPSKELWAASMKDMILHSEDAILSKQVYHQQLTHQTIYAGVIIWKIKKRTDIPDHPQWVHQKKLTQLAFPRIFRDILHKENLIPYNINTEKI
jgi:A/G-specific adenine glycosylase